MGPGVAWQALVLSLAGAAPGPISTVPERQARSRRAVALSRFHELLWGQSLAIVVLLVGSRDGPAATVSLWGLLHGLWALRQAGVLGGQKPADVDAYAFDTFLSGLKGRAVQQSNVC